MLQKSCTGHGPRFVNGQDVHTARLVHVTSVLKKIIRMDLCKGKFDNR